LITEVRQRGQSSSSSFSSSSSGLYLYQRIQFATEANPVARIAYGLYRGGFLNAVSVGFVPLRWVDGNGKEYSTKSSSSSFSSSSSNSELLVAGQSGFGPSAAQALASRPSTLDSGQRSAGGFRRKYLEQELLEVSAVGIPANPNALALGLKSGAVEKGDVRDTYELLRLTLESSPSLNPQLIKLAARLYETLRKI
jgi:phage head maturation protease